MKSLTTISLLAFCAMSPLAIGEVTLTPEGDTIRVAIDGQPFTEYRHEGLLSPVLYPVVGPLGVEMTRNYPFNRDSLDTEADDHPHHISLWYTHGDVNGVDFWAGGGSNPSRGGKILPVGDPEVTSGEKEGVLVTQNRWIANEGEREMCRDTRTIRFGENEDGSRYVDYSITINATEGDVVFGDTKEGSMAIRTNPRLRLEGKVATGRAINSEGDKDNDLWGKAAKWVDYWGEFDGKKIGVAILDHPTNPRHPTTWHAREYGLIAANPFGWSDFFGDDKNGDLTIKDDESVTFRYRFVFHEGDVLEAKIEEKFEAFGKSQSEE